MTRVRTSREAEARRRLGFTLMEVALAIGIALVLAAIAVPSYRGWLERTKTRRAVGEIRMIADRITEYEFEHEVYPPDLAAVGADGLRDPWGHPYVYLRIDGPSPPPLGTLRKDKNLVPLNTDYDLYSPGRDGDSKPPLNAKASLDDIVRANDGSFVGVASEY